MAKRKPSDPIRAKIISSSLLFTARASRVPHAPRSGPEHLARSIPAHLDDFDDGSGT
jgi:hypothetical protein